MTASLIRIHDLEITLAVAALLNSNLELIVLSKHGQSKRLWEAALAANGCKTDSPPICTHT